MMTPDQWKEDFRQYHERLYAEPQFTCMACKHELPESFMLAPALCFLCTPLTEEEQEDLDAHLRV